MVRSSERLDELPRSTSQPGTAASSRTLVRLAVWLSRRPTVLGSPIFAADGSPHFPSMQIVGPMKYEELIILLPCHSLEDFPLHHEGDDAQGLLANWSALWHPAFLAAADAMPRWYRVDNPPEQLTNRLIVVPSVSQNELPTGFAQRAKEEGACLIRKMQDRQEIVAAGLEQLDGGDGGVSAEFVADFLALGYCYLQVELLTRQMRYSSNLDEVHFNNQSVGAAKALMQGDEAQAREKLSACFSVLAEERDHYYPVDAFLLDLTLMAPTTVGQAFRDELAWPAAANLLIAADVLKTMADDEPQSLEALKVALEQDRVGLIGGEAIERRLPLLSVESILAELRRGGARYETLVGRRPNVFGRRRYGLTPLLPQILHKLGFEGALHATLDDGRFPIGTQIKTRWEGSDGSVINALARAPLDATKPETYLSLAVKMGESMDMDHVATVLLAHWPGQASVWLNDLRRIASYCTALGKFITIDEYFRETDVPVHGDRFTADQYRSPYMKQAIIRNMADPISTSMRYWRRRATVEAVEALSTLGSLVAGDIGRSHAQLIDEADQAADDADAETIDQQLREALSDAANRFADSLPRKKSESENGYLVVNACTFVRRLVVEPSELNDLPSAEKPVYAADSSHDRKHVVVDVPPMGFAWIAPGGKRGSPSRRAQKPLAEDQSQKEGYFLLRNEFFEVLIDSVTGALRSTYEYQTRGNRLSQQLGFRLPGKRAQPGDQYSDADEGAVYSVMAADSIEVTANSQAMGEIQSKGRLLDKNGKTLANYEQMHQIWRGSRVLRIKIKLDPQIEPKAEPWNSYFACRFAWNDEGADLWRTLHGTRQAVGGKRIESPHYLEIETPKTRTAILTGGLPFHRRVGMRMLDTLLIVRGERAREFELGVGIELTHPMHDAVSLLTPPTQIYQSAAPPASGNSGWLFHIDSKNVMATHWEPLVEDGKIAGFRVRLLETSGRTSRVGLSSFRAVKQARQVDFRGEPLSDCQIDDGRIRFEMSANEWVEVEAKW